MAGVAEFSLGDAVINIVGNVAPGLNKALGDAERRVNRSMGNIRKMAGQVGTAMLAAGAAITGAFAVMVKKAEAFGSTINDMATKTGMSTEALSGFAVAADLSGLSLEGVANAVKFMQKNLFAMGDEADKSGKKQKDASEKIARAIKDEEDALSKTNIQAQRATANYQDLAGKTGHTAAQTRHYNERMEDLRDEYKKHEEKIKELKAAKDEDAEATDKATQAIKDLGLSLEALKKLKPEEQFKQIGSKISALPTALERTGFSLAIFGRAGTDMLQMFAGGPEAFEELTGWAKKLGVELSGEQAAKLDMFGDKLAIVKWALLGVAVKITEDLLPTLLPLADKIA
ncbi:MAG: hypothetical protein AABY46_07295, partial [Nitrospirota bacterium]